VRPPLCGKSRYGIYCQPCHIQIANGSLPISNSINSYFLPPNFLFSLCFAAVVR